MTYVRYSNRQRAAWIAGTTGTPVGVATYRVANLTPQQERSVELPNTTTVGEDSPAPTRPGGRFMEFGFTSELRGSGDSNVPPQEGALLRACGFQETAGVGLTYTAGDTHLTSGTPAGKTDPVDIEIFQDGLFRKCDECVGNVVFTFEAGALPTYDWSWRGLVIAARKGGIEDFDPPTFVTGELPVPVQSEALNVNIVRSTLATVTGTVTDTDATTDTLVDSAATFWDDGVMPGDAIELDVGGETAIVVTVDSQTQITSTALSSTGTYDNAEAYTITKADYTTTSLVVPRIVCDMGNVFPNRNDVSGAHGFTQPIITGRNPVYTLLVEEPDLDTFNFEREYIEGTTLDVSWTHESGLGIRHELACKYSGVISAFPETQDVDGKLMYMITMDQAIATGDDKMTLAWKAS